MTWFERVMRWLGLAWDADLVAQKLNADFAFTKLGKLEPEFDALQEKYLATADAHAERLSVLRVRAGELVGDV